MPLSEPGLQRKEYPSPTERLQEATKDLPPDLSDCVGDPAVEDEGSEEEEGKQNSEEEGEGSDVEVVEPENEEFQQVLLRSGQTSHDSHGAHGKPPGDEDLEEVLRLSFEEYKESEKELLEFREAVRLSSLSADPVYQATGEASGEADAEIIDI